jgi:nitroreductase
MQNKLNFAYQKVRFQSRKPHSKAVLLIHIKQFAFHHRRSFMDGLEMLKTRRSVRAYSAEPVGDEILEKIIHCGRLAATARDIQSADVIVIKNEALKKKIAGATDYGKFIAQAPVCLAVVCQDTKYYLEDGSACAENILLAARYFGLGSCWVAGDKKPYAPKIIEVLSLPPAYKLVCLIPMGFPKESGAFYEKKLKHESVKTFD